MPSKNSSNELEHSVRDPTEMARILCVSEMELRRLTTAGVLVRTLRKRGGRQRVVYDWETNVMRFIHHMSQPEQQEREEYQREKRNTQSIVRQQKELELKIARGDTCDRVIVLTEMTKAIAQAKNHLLGLPARLARQMIGLKDPHKARLLLEQNIRNCLTEVSKIGVHSFMKLSKNGAKGSRND